ncbi:hypothetical protein AL037_11595 [Salipiger aestuarii]|nr:hypothetical protein AL037_11595 [Salipiger aestuarii]
MALKITEFFGFKPLDPAAAPYVSGLQCPFVGGKCIKPTLGACAVEPLELAEPVMCCPNRMYGESFLALKDLAEEAFGPGCTLIKPSEAQERIVGLGAKLNGSEVVVFGKYWGKELPLPRPKGRGAKSASTYYVDWVLARLNAAGELGEIIAVEVQTIDTTGSYRDQAERFFEGEPYVGGSSRSPDYSAAGMNWENVNKRILPQLIYKGHVLRREELCKKGLFFVCPKQVYDRILDRLGGHLHDYRPGQGTITFRSYELGPQGAPGTHRAMTLHGQFTTTVDQVALAFTSPMNLPEADVYAAAINKALAI